MIIYHIGAHGARNAGDVVILDCIQRLFPDATFINREDRIPFTGEDVDTINRQADLVLIGGGGLFIRDTAPNANSGWRWNISIDLLQQIEKPIAVFGIGHNRFRGQDDFIPVFGRHVSVLVDKSIFFGMREKDGPLLMSDCLDNKLVGKVKYQPCPAMFCNLLFLDTQRKRQRTVVFAPAMDRLSLRVNDEQREKTIRALKSLEKNFKVVIAAHLKGDKNWSRDFETADLSLWKTNEILDFYSKAYLVIGMRLHSLVIPFGLNVPFVGVATHDKIVRFVSDIGHPGWAIDVLDKNFDEQLLDKCNFDIQEREEMIESAQAEQWEISKANIRKIHEVLQ